MPTNQRHIKARENRIKCYEELGSVSKAALKCGVPRCTLYRWIKRFKEKGKDALQGQSKRPKRLAKQKISSELTRLIVSLRNQYNFGPQSISVHLLRMHSIQWPELLIEVSAVAGEGRYTRTNGLVISAIVVEREGQRILGYLLVADACPAVPSHIYTSIEPCAVDTFEPTLQRVGTVKSTQAVPENLCSVI